MQYIVTPVMTFINALSRIVTIHVNSLEGSLVAAKCQCLWGNCALHKIYLLCWHYA